MKVNDGKWKTGKWHRRFFVLDKKRGDLKYFHSEKDVADNQKATKPQGQVDLNHATASLLFQSQFADRAPTDWFFQVVLWC